MHAYAEQVTVQVYLQHYQHCPAAVLPMISPLLSDSPLQEWPLLHDTTYS